MTGADLDAVERRLEATRAVRQVIHAIYALAAAQAPLAEQAAADAARYADWIEAAVERVAGRGGPGAGDATLHVIVGPERPYCGALPRRIVEQVPSEGALGLVGARLAELADADPGVRERVRFRLPGIATHDEAGGLVLAIAEAVLRHAEGRRVDLWHPRAGSPELVGVMLLPERPRAPVAPPETLSPLELVVDAAMVELVSGRLAAAAAEALRAEVRARLLAADAARRACDRRIERLRADWRAARQDQITVELLEIVAARS
jgi:hypothetical protein